MIILGLTGSIGMGKSTVAAIFRDQGVPVFDADAEVYRLQGPGGELIDEIEAAFPGTTGPDGVIREKLGAAVFHNDDAMKRLEHIVHPAVGRARMRFLAEHAHAPLVIFDIPLLFETGGDRLVDKIAVVSAKHEVQRARVLDRSGMTTPKFEAILARQTPDHVKRAKADFIIPTDVKIDETRRHVHDLIACLTAPAGG